MKTSTSSLPPLCAVKILDQLRERIHYLHYSIRTEDVYVYWVKVFIRFHHVRHPAEMGAAEVEAFLSWLANERGVSVGARWHWADIS
ncbi:phage integrase N-terminal SAM-like domain-containing protein [Undibacterium arcticum]